MRISTPYQFQSYAGNVRNSYERYFEAQRQATTGKRWELASEDPRAATQSIKLRGLKERLEGLNLNLRSARDYLANGENALNEVSNLLRSASTLAIQGASSANDQTAMQGLVDSVNRIQERLVALANTQGNAGQYIFAGQLSRNKPFSITQSGATNVLAFAGDTNDVFVEIRPNEQMRVTLDDPQTFFSQSFDALERLKNNLASGDVLKLSNESVAELRTAEQFTLRLRGQLGGSLQAVADLENENARRVDDFKKDLGSLEEVDLSDAFVRLQQAQVAYQAALQTSAMGYQLNLMDFLR